MGSDPDSPRPEGLFGSLRRMVQSALGVLQTRLEILSTEVAEERFNLARLLIVALVVVFCLQLGLFLGALFLVMAVSEEHRLAAIGITALVLLLGAAGGVWWLRWWLKSRPPMFATTIAELRKDRARMGGEG